MGNYLARFVEHFRPLRDCVGKVRLRDDMLDSMCSKTYTFVLPVSTKELQFVRQSIYIRQSSWEREL